MAKKVILKDLDNVEILPITRGELIVDSSGKEAFHSNEFLATNSLPGLMSPEEKAKISTIAGNTIDSTLSTTSVNPVQNKVVTGAINEAKQLANDALETANDASENVSKVQQILNSIKESYLKSATVDGNVLTIVDLSDSEITFTNTTYNTFLKETAANTGGRNGLVPKPNYNDGSKTRFLREDGTWVVPTNTSYTFANGTDGSFTVTPSGGSGQKVTIGKPATAGTADKVSKALTIKIKTGATEGTDIYTYDGSAAKTLDIKAGNNITLTPTAGVLTIAATNSNTTYTLSGALDGNTFVTTLTPSSGTATTAVIPAMVGATSSAAGKAGLVPAPAANKHTSFLRGDGTWVVPTDTKNTAGSTNSTSKLFLIGATSQEANPQTYSNSSVYTTNGTLYATTFVGNLDGTYVNKLTGYKIAEAIGSISATDSLNTALGKLEFKTDFIYNDLFGTDNDDVINKWHEIVDFIDSVKEGTDILDEFVTRKTALTITGLKTFLSNSNATGISLVLKNSGWTGNMSTAMDFYNGNNYAVPNARIETKMIGDGKAGGTLIFYTLTKHASTNPNPNGLTERLRIDDNGITKVTGALTVTGDCDFSTGTVKLDTLHVPTTSGGSTYGAGTNGLVLKSNGTTVYWASDSNSTYAVYGKTIDASYKTAYRTQTGRASGYYLAAIRCDTASVAEAPQYGTGMAFGMADTHGYLYMNYSSANAYIGAGNADKLNWTATLLHSSNSSVSGGGSSWGSNITVKINNTTATLTIPANPNTWRPITNDYDVTTPSDTTSLSQTGAKSLLRNVRSFKRFTGSATNGGYDLNVLTDGMIYNYSSSGYWKNGPSGMSYGRVLNLKDGSGGSIAGLLAWDTNHASTTDTTRNLWWRVSDDGTFTEAKWHRIAYAEEIPTVTNYYWADILVSATSNAKTTPTFAQATATTSIQTPLVLNTSGILILNGKTNIYLKIDNTDSLSINLSATSLKPFGSAKNLMDLGTAAARWKGIYTNTGNFLGAITMSGTTEETAHISFTRTNYNYITFPDGYSLAFGIATGSANTMFRMDKTSFFPERTNEVKLGTSGTRWSNVYSVLGNFTSNVESTTSTGDAIKHAVTNTNGSVELLVHSNRGLYDRTNAKWIIYVPNGTSNVYVPTWASKGNSTTPVYFNANGEPIACTSYANYIKWTSADASLGVIGKLTLGSTTNTLYDLFITSNGAVIADSTDLNTIKTPGIRYSVSSTNSATMTNAPWTSSGFRLITLTGYSSSSSYGILLALSSQLFFWRTMGSSNASPSSWYSWILFKYGTAVGNSTTPIYINSSGTPTACTAYSGLLTALSSSSSTNLSITVGGTTKNITNTYATNITLISCYNGTTNNDLWSTIKTGNSTYLGTANIYEVYNDGGPTTYGEVLDIVSVHTNHWLSLLWFGAGKTGHLYYRNKDYNDATWGSWRTIIDTGNYSSYLGYIGTTAVQSSSATQALTGISRISNSTSAALYLGNSGNQSWVMTQDICSHSGSGNWAINIAGTGWFKVLNVGYTYNTSGSYAFNVTGTAGVSKLIVTTANLYRDAGGIILNNSDIWGLNAIYTADLADSATEGYLFKRTNGNYDSLWCKNGVFYFSPDGNSTDGYGTNYTVLHSGNSSVSGGGSSWGSSITVKINGTSKTLTIPSNPNTDSNVSLSETTTSSYRPVILGYTSSSTAGSGMTTSTTNVVYASNKFYALPSTGKLYATTFVGALSGNATTANGAYYVYDYNATTTPIYIGYSGAALSTATHFAAYGTTSSGARCIKDIAVATVKSVLGIPTVYARDIGVNGTNWTFYSSTNAATTSIYAPTSAGTSGYILQSSGGTPTWTARQDYSNPGILWVGYIYRSSRSSTSYYASKSGGKATFSLTSTPNSSYEYLSGTLSGHTSIMAAFVLTQAVFSAASTTCYAHSAINFGKGLEAGFDTYRVSISGSTVYIRACRMTDANNSSWEDDGFLCTGSGHDDDARPVARLYLMIIGY